MHNCRDAPQGAGARLWARVHTNDAVCQGRAASRPAQGLGQALHGVVGLGIVGDPLGGALARVQDGRVVAVAERAADRRQGLVGELAREVHGDLAGPGDGGGAARGEQRVDRDAEGGGGLLLDLARRRLADVDAPAPGRGRRAPRAASSAVTARPVSEPNATTRISAPSSVRTFSRHAVGDQVERLRVDAGDARPAARACAGSVRRVARSGAPTSATRPASKRSRRRSSSSPRSRGRRSDVSTICAPAS